MHPLVEEAMKKAAIAWVGVGGRPAVPIWCLWFEDALYAVGGPGEQPAPGLAGTFTATVTARGDHGGRIVTWPAQVRRVDPESSEWASVAPQLAGKRLNAPASADDLVARWARECAVHFLVPADAPVEAGSTLPDASQAEPPRETPVVRATRRPFRLHRVRRRD